MGSSNECKGPATTPERLSTDLPSNGDVGGVRKSSSADSDGGILIRNGPVGTLDGATTEGAIDTSIITISSRAADVSLSGLKSSEEGCELARGAL